MPGHHTEHVLTPIVSMLVGCCRPIAGRRALAVLVFLLSGLCALAPGKSHGYPVPPSDESRVQAGMFLVAKPELRDPLFRHTVIFITVHNRHGTIGLIVNRPTQVRLKDALPHDSALSDGKAILYIGGPVHTDSLFSLVKSDRPFKDAQPVIGKVYFMAGLDALKRVLARHEPGISTRSYAGYSGWSPGQLRAEIERGDWLVIEADASTIFKKDPRNVWRELIKSHLGRWL